MTLRETIDRLARMTEGPAVVTAYLDARWRDEQQRDRVRVFSRDRIREALEMFGGQPGFEGIETTLGEVGAFVDGLVNQEFMSDARGVMVVASAPRGIFEIVEVDFAFDSALYVDIRPRLAQLIESWVLEKPALIACVETGHVHLIELSAGFVVEEHEIERDVPKRHAQGGWSQRKFQRHVKEHIRMVWKEGARRLEELSRAHGARSVVLFGQDTNVRGFERELPAWLMARVAGRRPWVRDRNAVLDGAREVLNEVRLNDEFAIVHRILRQGLSDRTGTVGIRDTLMAIDERRVRALVLSRRFDAMGYRCRTCESIWETGATGCVFCGGPMISVPLREELTRRALVHGADLYLTSETSALDAYRGIGSLLRHLTGEEHRFPKELMPEPMLH